MKIPDQWKSKRKAARILGVHPSTVDAVAMAGGVRLRDLPGTSRRYHADDLKALAEAAEHKAGSPPTVQGVAS